MSDLKQEIANGLHEEVKKVGNWLTRITPQTNPLLIAFCSQHLQTLLSAMKELEAIPDNTQEQPVSILKTSVQQLPAPVPVLVPKSQPLIMPSYRPPHRGRGLGNRLTDFGKQIVIVFLGLDGGELPKNLREASSKAWADELKQDPSDRRANTVYMRARNLFLTALPKVKVNLFSNQIPAEDTELYERITARYPGMTVEQFDEITAHYKKDSRLSESETSDLPEAAAGETPDESEVFLHEDMDDRSSKVSKPQTEWLQTIWAILFHPNGATLNQAELIGRLGISNLSFDPVVMGALKNMHLIISGNLISPEQQFTDIIIETWRDHTLLEILQSIHRGSSEELSLDQLKKEISNVEKSIHPKEKERAS